MKKKINIVRLSSNISTKIGYNPNRLDTNKLYYFEQGAVANESQHLYFLSDEEIKEGDWCLLFDDLGNLFSSLPQQYLGKEKGHFLNNGLKKIIATTNDSLKIESELNAYYRNGVGGALTLPRPTNEFLKRYCELGGINEVLVEYEDISYPDLEEEIPQPKKYKLKVAPDNTINVSFIEEKMYSRKEVVDLFNKWFQDYHNSNETFVWGSSLNDWIKENL